MGLTHGFGPKMVIFPIFFFLRNVDQENVFYDIQEQKKRLSRPKKQELQKVENLTFLERR